MKSDNRKIETNIKFPYSQKKTKNANEKKNFGKLSNNIISYNLFPFFNKRDAKEFGKIDSRFYNCFSNYYIEYFFNLINKYNLKIGNKFLPNVFYEQKDDKGHFIKMNFFSLKHYLIFSYYDWAWKNDNRYWTKLTPKNSILHKAIFRLKTVCLINVCASMTHIFEGKYKLYLNHCVCNLNENKIKMKVLLDDIPLKEFIYPSSQQVHRCKDKHGGKGEEDKTVKSSRGLIFMQRKNVSKIYNKDNDLFKDYIMDINVVYNDIIDNSIGHKLTVNFDNIDGSWKNNWLIDAVILEKQN